MARLNDTRTRYARLRAVAGLVAALVVVALAVSRLAERGSWLSTARRVDWRGPDGAPVRPPGARFPWHGCSSDIQFDLLLDGHVVWVRCRDSEEWPGGGLARIDLDTKQGRLVAGFPPDWKAQWVEGLLPGSVGEVAVVMRTPEGFGAGVAGPEGWRVQPVRLSGVTDKGELLGMSFRDGAFEIAAAPRAGGEPVNPLIFRLAPGERPAPPRPVSHEALRCAWPCWFEAAYRPPGEAKWRFLVNSLSTGAFQDIAEDGSAPRTLDPPTTGRPRYALDLVAVGVLQTTLFPPRALQTDGSIRNPIGLPAAARRPLSPRRLLHKGDTLEIIPTWLETSSEPMISFQVVGGRTLSAWRTKEASAFGSPGAPGWHDERLHVADRTDPQQSTEAVVARSHDCADLALGAFVPVEGGTILFHGSGCYVMLDEAWRRRDGFGLLDHLRQRGSMYAQWNEPGHAVSLAWVLFGLPIAAGAAAAFGRVRRLAGAWQLGVWFYVLTGAWLLRELWPLMR